MEILTEQDSYTVSEIEQIYISFEKGVTHRIRRRAYKDKTVCTETKKYRIDEMSVYEDEKQISETCYSELATRIESGTRPIRKIRHTFVFDGQLFEIDEYDLWQSSCILETELKSREDEVSFPPFITVIKEVTGEKKYSNASMSHNFPEEIC